MHAELLILTFGCSVNAQLYDRKNSIICKNLERLKCRTEKPYLLYVTYIDPITIGLNRYDSVGE